jgi:hypothetical protein
MDRASVPRLVGTKFVGETRSMGEECAPGQEVINLQGSSKFGKMEGWKVTCAKGDKSQDPGRMAMSCLHIYIACLAHMKKFL